MEETWATSSSKGKSAAGAAEKFYAWEQGVTR